MKKKIIITGGSGFIGTNLIEFYKNTCELINIDNKKPRNKNQLKFWKKENILNKKEITTLFRNFNPDYVFHMAARTDLDGKKLEDYDANTIGVENIIHAVNKTDSIKKVIFASSRLVCEIGYNPKNENDYKPSTIYGESKIIGEKIVRESKSLNKEWIIVRPTSLWGPWFDVPYKNFFDAIKRNVYIHPKGKLIHKKFGYVENCVFIMNAILSDKKLNTKTIYLSDFNTLEIYEWANIISNKFHGHKVKSAPTIVLKILAKFGDVLKAIGYKSAPITSFRLNNIMTNMDYDTSSVEAIVGKLPYSLEEATNITYKWYKENT